MVSSLSSMLLVLTQLLLFLPLTWSAETKYVTINDPANPSQQILVLDDRKPSLYTQNFGDCLGSSLINVTRFDAAYYQDNMTVLFHLEGNTNVRNESIMMYIGVFAYGLQRFELTFNPCHAQIYSLCPMNRSVPIEANGIIPVSQSDVAGIPPIALSIPDFEGEAVLRIFGNSTQSEIGCYSAVITNGASFSHPSAIGTMLGIFTIVAFVASFATAIYGNHIPTMRTHYAHSLSVFVIFAVFHHIFFTGALSMNWPSVVVAFWSNFAWTGGMIYSDAMQNSINQFIGANKGNTSVVGAAGPGPSANGIGGGYQLSQIYKRASLGIYRRFTGSIEDQKELLRVRSVEHHLAKRALANSTDGYSWYGHPVKPGLPIPGNFSGFAGTLSEEGIPASNAFMTGFLWLLILMVIIAASIVAFKWILEGLCKKNLLRTDKLSHFRTHWVHYTAQALLRATFIGFFMMMFLVFFEFTYKGSAGATALAAIIFIIIFFGMTTIAGYACFYRLRSGRYESRPDRIHFEKGKALKYIPWYGLGLESNRSEKVENKASAGSLPFLSMQYINDDPQRLEIHQDEDYVQKFGWLSARFRRTKWWFFAFWLLYEFVRACFFGGAAGRPLVQVFGLLVVEIIALIFVVVMRPFEGARLNALMVYLLGFSKVTTTALSASFHPRFNLARITATAIGIVIIVIQGILTAVLLVAIVIGAISTYMSLTRNNKDFKPKAWTKLRQRYFAHIEKTAPDVPPPPPPPEELKEPYFNVASVRRQPKIEDENEQRVDNGTNPHSSRVSVAGPGTTRASRANSSNQFDGPYTTVPFGARVHRASWSTRDFQNLPDNSNRNSRALSSGGVDRNSHGPNSLGMRAQASQTSLRQQRARTPKDASQLDSRRSRAATDKGKRPALDERNSEEQEKLESSA